MTAILSIQKQTSSVDIVSTTETVLSVLLVDDDERYLKLCERYLARCQTRQFLVDTAGTISEALECCRSNKYDCLVIDYLLPDGTGTGLVEKLSQNINKIAPPTIVTTADGGENAAAEAIRAGAVDFMSKRNVNSHSLSRSIHNAVEKFRLAESLKLRNSELVLANQRLRSNRREIMQFYHTVSHEVKTPLAAAREFISLVKDGADGKVSEGQHHLLQLAIDSCDQIKNQFTELLDMTRLESGKLELKRSATCVDDLVVRSVTSVSELARSRQINVRYECVANMTVSADPDRIVQVLSNLLHNAVKFSADGSEVVLYTLLHSNSGRLEFRVEDTGCGIAKSEQSSVFDRLFQSEHKRAQSSANGLGLGLAIAKDIVKLHGEQLRVNSTLNIGSAFYFELPIETEKSH